MVRDADRGDTAQFGPAVVGVAEAQRPPKRRRSRVWLPILFVLILAGTATATITAHTLLSNSAVGELDVDGLGTAAPAVPGAPVPAAPALQEVSGVTNLLVVGIDSREGLTDEELLRLGTRDDGTNLTDTLMLVQLDADNRTASILSFPRDLLVRHCDGTLGRINDAYGTGEATEGPPNGPECLFQTVTRLSGIPIDHYVQVDFQGFIRAVDAVGGVTFYVDEPLRDDNAGLNIPAGCVTFDGPRALTFVRARHLDPSGDYGRIARQQRFLRELLGQAISRETLSDPGRITELVDVLNDSISTDDGLSVLDLARYGYTFRDISDADLRAFAIPAFDDYFGDAQVLDIDEVAAEPLFRAFRLGTIDEQAPPGSIDVPGAPGAVGSGDADAPASAPVQGSGTVAAPPSPSGAGVAVPAQSTAGPTQPEPSPAPTYRGATPSDVAC